MLYLSIHMHVYPCGICTRKKKKKKDGKEENDFLNMSNAMQYGTRAIKESFGKIGRQAGSKAVCPSTQGLLHHSGRTKKVSLNRSVRPLWSLGKVAALYGVSHPISPCTSFFFISSLF